MEAHTRGCIWSFIISCFVPASWRRCIASVTLCFVGSFFPFRRAALSWWTRRLSHLGGSRSDSPKMLFSNVADGQRIQAAYAINNQAINDNHNLNAVQNHRWGRQKTDEFLYRDIGLDWSWTMQNLTFLVQRGEIHNWWFERFLEGSFGNSSCLARSNYSCTSCATVQVPDDKRSWWRLRWRPIAIDTTPVTINIQWRGRKKKSQKRPVDICVWENTKRKEMKDKNSQQ